MKTWIQQKGLIPVMLLAGSLWFLWDGLIGYRRSNERWAAHERLKATPDEWGKYCMARGWTTEPPEKYFEPGKIYEQRILAGVLVVLGLFSLAYWQRARKSAIRSDADAVHTPSGRRVPYGSITQIDRKKWKSKGLATVYYSLDGAKGRFVLDDAKYEPTALDAILADIEQHTAGRAKVDE